MMNKLAIPALLLGVVMIAGAFAFMPVQEASTVHTSVGGAANQFKVITAPQVTGLVIEGGATTTLTCATGCIVHGITISMTSADASGNIAGDAMLVDGSAIGHETFTIGAGVDIVDVSIFTSATPAFNVSDAATEMKLPIAVENDFAMPILDAAGTWAVGDDFTVKFLITEGADNTASAITA